MNPSTVRAAQLVILALGGLAFVAWFFAAPDFHNLLQWGLGSLGGRAVPLFGILAVGLTQLALAAAVWKAPHPVLTVLAWVMCAFDVLGAVGVVALNVALSNFNMH